MIVVFVSVAILVVPLGALSAGGFSDDPDRIELAAQSVLMLEIYDQNDELIATGSGFVAFDGSTLITNEHVIEGGDIIIGYSDSGDQYVLDRVLITDDKRDIAILGFSTPTELVPLTFNDQGTLKRAQKVVAIGSPIGITNTVSIGNISALYEEAGISEIQFTAPISPGSSGGALFDDNGEVIGITSATYLDAQNINIAVHASEVIGLYARWEKSYLTISGDPLPSVAPTVAPTATPAPRMDRNIRMIDRSLIWCDPGSHIENEATAIHDFDWINVSDLSNARDYYASLVFSLDAGMKDGTAMDFAVRLYSGEALLGSAFQTESFGMYETLAVHRFFDLGTLMNLIPGAGAYEFAFYVGDAELGRCPLEVYENGVTPPPAEPAPAPRLYHELKLGDKGDAVKELQTALIAYNYLGEGTADGIFGKMTRAAVVQFNLANALSIKRSGSYTSDPEIASPEMQELLFEGEPVAYTKPVKSLYFRDDAYVEGYGLSEDLTKIRFEISNKVRGKTVVSFELSVYAANARNKKLYGDRTYDWRTSKKIEPGETVVSAYVTIPQWSEIEYLYVGITKIFYEDGTADYFYGDDIKYETWILED